MSWNSAVATEYAEEVKKFTDEQLYSEYSRIKTALEKKTDGPFPRRTRRKQRSERGDSSYRPPFGPSSEPNHHPDKLYCLCQQRDDGRTYMQCNGCNEWYHPECVGLKSNTDRYKNDIWECPKCKKGNLSDTYSPSKSPTPRKKRKGVPDSRDRKRMKGNNHPIRETFSFPPPGEQRRRKNGKRKRSEFEEDIPPKRLSKSKSKQKKKYTKATAHTYDDDESESYEDIPYSVNSFVGAEQSTYSPIGGTVRFGSEKMRSLLENIIKGERRLEKIKMQRMYEKQISSLKKQGLQYQKRAENEVEDMEKLQDENDSLKIKMESATLELGSLREYQDNTKERHGKRIKKLKAEFRDAITEVQQRNKQLEHKRLEYENREDYNQKYILEKSLKEMEEDRDKALDQIQSYQRQLETLSKDLQMRGDEIKRLKKLQNNPPKNKLSNECVTLREQNKELLIKHSALTEKLKTERQYNQAVDVQNKQMKHQLNAGKGDFVGNRNSLVDQNRKLKSQYDAVTERVKVLEQENSQLRSESKIKMSSNLKNETKTKKKKNKRKPSNQHSNSSILPTSNSKPPLQENITIQTEYNMKPATRKHAMKCRLCHEDEIVTYRMLVCARGDECSGGSDNIPEPVAYHTRCSRKLGKAGMIDGKWHCRACQEVLKKNQKSKKNDGILES